MGPLRLILRCQKCSAPALLIMRFHLRRGDFLKPLCLISLSAKKPKPMCPIRLSVSLCGDPALNSPAASESGSVDLFKVICKEKNPSPGCQHLYVICQHPRKMQGTHQQHKKHPLPGLHQWACSLLPATLSALEGLTLNSLCNNTQYNIKLWQVKVQRLPVMVSGCKNVFKAIYGQAVIPKSWLQIINQGAWTTVLRLPCGGEKTGSAHWLVPDAKMESSLTSPHF